MRVTCPNKLAFIPAVAAIALSASATLPATAQLAAALLPSSRSAEVNSEITVFSTVINAGTETATGCQIDQLSALPLTVSFQTTDPETNLTTGTPNTPVDILAGESQSFALTIVPTAVVDSTQVEFSYNCASGETAETFNGVNTLLLSASDTPVVDVVALAATAENSGVLTLGDSIGAFALSSVNLGITGTVTVTADTGDENLPLELSLCETNPLNGSCLATPSSSVETNIETGASPTFSVFSSAFSAFTSSVGAIDIDPAINRVFVRFTDADGIVRGGTSEALENELLGE